MRDFLVLCLVVLGCLAALRRPWIGVMVWTWVSIMNPHRYTYGVAYDAPVAALPGTVKEGEAPLHPPTTSGDHLRAQFMRTQVKA